MGGEERNPRIVKEFKRRRRVQLLVTVPMLAAMYGVVRLGEVSPRAQGGPWHAALMGAVIGIIVGCGAFTFANWRCPTCNGYLGKGFNPRFCSKCGAPLR